MFLVLQQPKTLRWHCMSSLHLYLSLLCLQARAEGTFNKAKHGNAASVFPFSAALSFSFVRQKKKLYCFFLTAGDFLPLKLIHTGVISRHCNRRGTGTIREPSNIHLTICVCLKTNNKDIRRIFDNNSAEG